MTKSDLRVTSAAKRYPEVKQKQAQEIPANRVHTASKHMHRWRYRRPNVPSRLHSTHAVLHTPSRLTCDA